MYYRIAICDREWKACSDLEEMLLAMQQDLDRKFEVDIYYSPESLLRELEKQNYQDLIFLNLDQAASKGGPMETILQEHLLHGRTRVVCLSEEFHDIGRLFRGYITDFLQKPVTMEHLKLLMLRILHRMEQEMIFQCRNGKNIYRIPYEDILYFRSEGHKVAAVLAEREMHSYNKLSLMIPEMPPDFFPIHKSFVINPKYIRHYAYDYVEMENHHVLSISRTYRKQVRRLLWVPG